MFTKPFPELSKHDANIAGGKGASLGEMTQAGIPVPPGFVVLADTFEKFIKETDINVEIDSILHTVDPKAMHTVDGASEKIQSLIKNATMPTDIADEILEQFEKLGAEYVAVRSSATAEDSASAAWAGQLDSFLNTTRETVLEKVQFCWASLFTPRAIFYRFEKELHETKISVAVVVQKMVESEVSGIAFSVHPVTEDHNQLIIEAGFGLGEAIVSGSVTPDSYVVEKEPRNILDINVSTQDRALYRAEKASVEHGNNEWINIPEPKASSQVLTETQILELSEIILRIENHYGFPCDIEWAHEDGKFYIVQSRPITTLSETMEDKNIFSSDINLIEEGVQLELWLERKNLSPLIISLFHLLEGPKMQELIGGGFSKEIAVVKEGISYWIRPAQEITGLVKLHQEFISKSNTADLKKLLDRAINIYNTADGNIVAIADSNDDQFSENVEMFLNQVSDILLYTTTIPYFLLSALENSNVEKTKYEIVYSKCEEMRGDSKYVKAQEVFIPKLTQYLNTKHGLTEEEAKDIAYDELLSLLNDGDWKKDERLSQRGHSSVFWLDFKNGKHKFNYDQRIFDYFYNKYVKVDIINGQDRIIGNTANKGFAKGCVVIVNSPDELKKVQTGDIVVSRNTNPSIMPALKKCAAIITDEGGIACHAAIVSRELNIPCIIGTKIATRVLKDGDMVEVDADNGVVRIIEQ